ncbi:MAG: hypothetical protein SFV51_24025 [Bryobacteraceae bacterium]|nr:hypothetical protein [Bryobacteraceae bacterium]
MRRFLNALSLLACLLPAGLYAQDSLPQSLTFGYAFAGPVFVPRSGFTRWDGTFVHAGGGGEAGIGRYLSAGGEVGILAPLTNEFARTGGILAGGISVHPRGPERHWDPFLSGGVGVLAGGGAAGLAYVGGGVHYWFRPRIGLRFEYRHHLWPNADGNIQLAGLRLGIALR